MKKSHIVITTVVVTVVVISVLGAVLKSKNKTPKKGPKVRIEQAQRGELIEFVSAPGQIEPKTKVAISAKVSARIIELPYEQGDTVTCGDPEANPPVPPSVLIRLDAKDLESQLRSAQANYSAQAAQTEVEKARIASQQASLAGLAESLKQAQRELNRKKGLFETHDISQATLDQAQCQVDEQSAQCAAAGYTKEAAELNLIVLHYNLEAAEARIAQAQEALTYTIITSPIKGVITRINAEVGEVVIFGTMNNPGTVIMEVADLSQMLVVAQVDESDVGSLKVGQTARVHIQAWPNKVFSGIVQTIALSHKQGNQGSKYYETEISLAEPGEQIFTGMTAEVDIEVTKHKDVLTLPSQAVLGRKVDELPVDIRDNLSEEERTRTYATVVCRYVDGKAVVTPIKIGQSDLTHTIILSGITEEDKIVVGPYKVLEKLKHNKKIRDEREEKKQKKDIKAGADSNDVNDISNGEES